MKYWVCKRGAPLAAEALECLGGNGYVEEAPMAQFYRDIQIGTVWEGSGNVIALDVLRALGREPEGAPAFLAECQLAAGANRHFDAHLQRLREGLAALAGIPPRPSGALAASSRTWRSRCRPACCCSTRRRSCPMPSAPHGWVRAAWRLATFRAGSPGPRSWSARWPFSRPGGEGAARAIDAQRFPYRASRIVDSISDLADELA